MEELLVERGIDVTYETVRCWANKFGPAIAVTCAGHGTTFRLALRMVGGLHGRPLVRLQKFGLQRLARRGL